MPESDAEVAAIVRGSAAERRRVRVAGAGHSFSPLCATDDVLISLERLTGIESADPHWRRATIRAGTRIRDLGAPLAAMGLALENQGDIDVQTLAGAISTGTHGTGRILGSLSTQVDGLRVVTALGETVEWSAECASELWSAARVALGALGVVTAVRLRLIEAYRLHERLWQEPVEQCLDALEEHIASNRHFEFFWYPATDLAHMKALNPADAQPEEVAGRSGERIDESFRVFPSVRDTPFDEMEYSVPAEAGPACFTELRQLMRMRHPHVTWPVEYRTLAPDDIDLSTAFGRATVTLSIHQDARLPYEAFFRDAEAIFQAHNGRPHWGKIHWMSAEQLAAQYAQWDNFQTVRRRQDPRGMFLNEYLRQLFET